MRYFFACEFLILRLVSLSVVVVRLCILVAFIFLLCFSTSLIDLVLLAHNTHLCSQPDALDIIMLRSKYHWFSCCHEHRVLTLFRESLVVSRIYLFLWGTWGGWAFGRHR